MGFYLLVNIGALAGQLGMVYAEKNIGEFSGPFFALTGAETLGVPRKKAFEHHNKDISTLSGED